MKTRDDVLLEQAYQQVLENRFKPQHDKIPQYSFMSTGEDHPKVDEFVHYWCTNGPGDGSGMTYFNMYDDYVDPAEMDDEARARAEDERESGWVEKKHYGFPDAQIEQDLDDEDDRAFMMDIDNKIAIAKYARKATKGMRRTDAAHGAEEI